VRRREQTFRRERYLEPREALRRLLRNSSFVRAPAAVVRRAAMEREGLFDTTVGDAADTDMWVRLFSRYGVRLLPQATCAYTIHEAAATTGMWHPGTIRDAHRIFDRAVARGIVPERTIRRWQADFLHQFILAGAYRRLRMRRRAEAREVLRLFELPEVRDRGVSPKWLPVRAAFMVATAGARPKAG
jgi:GT2 family glycosyltransferase